MSCLARSNRARMIGSTPASFGWWTRTAAVLMDIDPLRNVAAGLRQPFTPAEWATDDPDRPVLCVTTAAPGLLVVADTWMPGWSALVDGLPVPVLRGNHSQRVIPLVNPGRHTIALRLRPPGFVLGCALRASPYLCGY